MDNFDFKDEQPVVKRSGSRFSLWDMLSILVLILTLCIGGYFAMIFVNPNTPLNPLPPPPTPFQFPTSTITPIQPEATWTATVVITTPTGTLAPLITVEPSNTPVLLVPPTATPTSTATPKPTSTPKAPFSSSYTNIASTTYFPDLGCGWFGVAGTIVDAKNSPIIGMVIRLTGTLNGVPIKMVNVSNANVIPYGPSGFEFKLGDVPGNSTKTLYLQVLDQAGLPLSDNLYINTFSDCNKNLVMVRFKKNP